MEQDHGQHHNSHVFGIYWVNSVFTGIFQSCICQLIQLYLASWFIASYQFVPGMVSAVLEQKIKTTKLCKSSTRLRVYTHTRKKKITI